MKSLIASLLLWIGAETSYNVDLPHPEIIQIPSTTNNKTKQQQTQDRQIN